MKLECFFAKSFEELYGLYNQKRFPNTGKAFLQVYFLKIFFRAIPLSFRASTI